MMRSEERGARCEVRRTIGSRSCDRSAPVNPQSDRSSAAAASNRHSDPPRSSRRGVTLVELLITLLIISILAGLILGVAAVAGEKSREANSRHIVGRLHGLLMEHYGTYKTRRVRLRPAIIEGINASNSGLSRDEKLKAPAAARLNALRELIMMEVPDRWSDVLLAPVPNPPTTPNDDWLFPYFQDGRGSATGRTGLADVYLRRYIAIATRINSITGDPNTRDEIIANQGAECLYMIITLATGDGEARSLFAESGIGDTDGDGAPEFLDGWKRPINFIRWAPGFDSQIQIDANTLGAAPSSSSSNELWKSAAAGDHDPFDVYRVDDYAYRLVPLIFSDGGNEQPGILVDPEYVVMVGLTPAQLNQQEATPPKRANWQDIVPWRSTTEGYLGTDLGEGSKDNIHNHLLGQR